MSYKNVQHYRYTVHRYLDAIWKLGYNKSKARTSMYSILSNRMGLPLEKTHVKYFTRAQCKEAIKILRPMYIQLYGKDLEYNKRGKNKMFKSSTKVDVTVSYQMKFDEKTINIGWNKWKIYVYCSANKLDVDGRVADYNNIKEFIIEKLDNRILNEVFDFNPTIERVMEWLCEQIVPSYKIKVVLEDGTEFEYEEKEI